MCFLINSPKFTYDMPKRGLTNVEIGQLMRASSDKEGVSEIDYHVSKAELSSDDKEDEESHQSANLSSTLLSKDGKFMWKSELQASCGRSKSENVKLTLGPTRCASFKLQTNTLHSFFPFSNSEYHTKHRKIEGKEMFDDSWKNLNNVDLEAFIGLLLLSGVYKSRNESTESKWDATMGRNDFRATMPLENITMISSFLRFDDRKAQPRRREIEKFAAIREVWDKWVELLPMFYNPEMYVTVNEQQLFAFRGKCPFRQYMTSKPAECGIKCWVFCVNATNYAWNIQPYLEK